MTKIVGTYSLEDLLAQEHNSAADFGFDAIAKAIQDEVNFLNGQVAEQMSMFCEETSDARRVWGTSENMDMKEVDELGVARGQRPSSGLELGFPLRKFSVTTGFTNDWLERASVADVAKRALGRMGAYKKRVRDEIKFGVFNNANYNFTDFLTDNTAVAVKAFINADSALIPNSPDGATFAGASHQHYVGTVDAALAFGDIDLLLANVTEHGNMKQVHLVINEADVATLVALTSTKFVALTPVSIITGAGNAVQQGDVNDDPANKLVGYWAGYPVITRSWCIDNYYVAVALDANGQKPLVYRVDKVATIRGLRLMPEMNAHPMTAQMWEAVFGVGAWNRSAVAVLYSGAQTTYTKPTLIR
jgi:hypothetical protein